MFLEIHIISYSKILFHWDLCAFFSRVNDKEIKYYLTYLSIDTTGEVAHVWEFLMERNAKNNNLKLDFEKQICIK